MSHDGLLSLIRQRPFIPFRLVTTDGTSYEIRHPEMLMPGKRTATVGIPDDPAIPAYERTITVALLHIQRLEPLQPAKTSGNGSN